ncbi:hypothetical protein BGZ46_006163, partial [Entomortierella lignicola]
MESPSSQQQPPTTSTSVSGPATPVSANNTNTNTNNNSSFNTNTTTNTTNATNNNNGGGGSGNTVDQLPMEDVVSTNAVTAEVIARQNQAVVEEFQYLLEKSQQLFAGLRDLPPTGAKQWQPYFQKTFEIFSK